MLRSHHAFLRNIKGPSRCIEAHPLASRFENLDNPTQGGGQPGNRSRKRFTVVNIATTAVVNRSRAMSLG